MTCPKKMTLLWAKNGYPKFNPGKWNQGLKPAAPKIEPWQMEPRAKTSGTQFLLV